VRIFQSFYVSSGTAVNNGSGAGSKTPDFHLPTIRNRSPICYYKRK